MLYVNALMSKLGVGSFEKLLGKINDNKSVSRAHYTPPPFIFYAFEESGECDGGQYANYHFVSIVPLCETRQPAISHLTWKLSKH